MNLETLLHYRDYEAARLLCCSASGMAFSDAGEAVKLCEILLEQEHDSPGTSSQATELLFELLQCDALANTKLRPLVFTVMKRKLSLSETDLRKSLAWSLASRPQNISAKFNVNNDPLGLLTTVGMPTTTHILSSIWAEVEFGVQKAEEARLLRLAELLVEPYRLRLLHGTETSGLDITNIILPYNDSTSLTDSKRATLLKLVSVFIRAIPDALAERRQKICDALAVSIERSLHRAPYSLLHTLQLVSLYVKACDAIGTSPKGNHPHLGATAKAICLAGRSRTLDQAVDILADPALTRTDNPAVLAATAAVLNHHADAVSNYQNTLFSDRKHIPFLHFSSTLDEQALAAVNQTIGGTSANPLAFIDDLLTTILLAQALSRPPAEVVPKIQTVAVLEMYLAATWQVEEDVEAHFNKPLRRDRLRTHANSMNF